MKILTTESFNKIIPLLRENYSNIHARLALKLSPDTADMFSKFTMQPSKGGAQWSVNIPEEETLRPMSEASEFEKDQISITLKKACAEVRQAFPSLVDKLFTVPDIDSIYFCRRGHRTLVILTAWGFRRVNTTDKTSVIRLCLDRAEELTNCEVDIKVSYTDGTPAADTQFRLHIFNNAIPFTTDSDGLFHPGHIIAGKSFVVESKDGIRSQSIMVEKDRSLYEVILDKTTKLTVHVEQANGTPAPDITALYDGRELKTDKNGNAIFGPDIFSGEKNIVVSINDMPPVSHMLKEDPQENIINFILPKNDNTPPEPPEEKGPVSIKIVDKHGCPQCGMPVKIMCKKGYEETVTDNNGMVYLKREDLVPGEKPKIILKRPKPSKNKLNSSTPPATNTDNKPIHPAEK